MYITLCSFQVLWAALSVSISLYIYMHMLCVCHYIYRGMYIDIASRVNLEGSFLTWDAPDFKSNLSDASHISGIFHIPFRLVTGHNSPRSGEIQG